jgi:hypothetical protein
MSIVKSFAFSVVAAGALLSATAALASKPETFANGRSWYGVPNSAEQARLVVDVKKTQYININCGDTVTFRNGDKSFTWRFDFVNHGRVDARKVAPVGFLAGPLMVYVRPNEYERN